jgi:hypothetical protein
MVEALPMTEPMTKALRAVLTERARLTGRSGVAGVGGATLRSVSVCERLRGRGGVAMPAEAARDCIIEASRGEVSGAAGADVSKFKLSTYPRPRRS